MRGAENLTVATCSTVTPLKSYLTFVLSCPTPQEAVDLPLYLFDGNVDARAAAFVADLLDDDEDEAELPALAKRTPIVLAAAVQS